MKRFLKENSWCFYLGTALALLGFDFLTWQFWVIAIPMAALVEWYKS